MYFNLIHRPNLSESYEFQRNCAHKLSLKVTQLVPTTLLSNYELIKIVKEDNEKYKDEIGLWLTSLESQSVEFPWLLSQEEKEETVKYSVSKFKEIFGYTPKVCGNYLMDANLIKLLKNYCPTLEIAVSGCFEEGVRVFHGCNNSWYLFSEGMSWNPWYISKTHSMRPAKNKEDWSGVIGLPHLSRDLAMSFEGRDDYYASHPANAQRGLVNDGLNHNYDYNLIDQYRMQEDYNNGFSYYQMHVSPGWFKDNPNLIDDDSVTRKIYFETLTYLKELIDENKIIDLTVGEFADIYKEKVKIGTSDIGVGKDILYGSGKHFLWITNKSYRILIDAFQGGTIGDLRPYISEYTSYTGSDTKALYMNSYPYLIQSQFRTGTKNHLFDGSRTTLFVKYNNETLDLCNYPSKIEKVTKENDKETLLLTPVKLKFKDGFYIEIKTCYDFFNNGEIKVTRKILNMSCCDKKVEFVEYLKGSFGFTEYPEDMRNIECFADDKKVFDYKYKNNTFTDKNISKVSVKIPDINTKLEFSSKDSNMESASIKEGHLFSPFYTMELCYNIKDNVKEVSSWIKIKKIKE